MITPMDQLTVVGRRSIARELLQSLQSLGVVQVDPLEPEEGLSLVRYTLEGDDRQNRERWSKIVGRTDTLLSGLGARDEEPAPRSEAPSEVGEIERYLADLGPQVDNVVAERSRLRDELDLIRTYLPLFRTLAPTLAQLEGSRYLSGYAFLVAADAVAEVRSEVEDALGGNVAFASRPYGRQTLVTAAALKRDESTLRQALSRLGISPLTLPGRYADQGVAKAVHVMEERSQTLPRRIESLEQELRQLREANGGRLQAVHQLALNQQVRFEKLEDLLSGRYSVALRGWVPASETRRVIEGLRKQFGQGIVAASRPANEHHDHDVPVKLENPGWVRPFEMLLSLFAPPRYGSFDPSWTLAIFFPLYFGIVLGDIGFGLLFLALGLWLRNRGRNGSSLDLGPLGIVIPPASLPTIGTLVIWASVWGIVWGFIYGEFFGNFLEHWPHDNPVFYPPAHGDHGMIPILLFRVEEFTPLLLLTIGFGVLQVIGGWVIRAYYGALHHDRAHLWEGIGMVSGLIALVVFATAFLTGALGTAVWIVVIAGLAVFLLSVFLAGIPLMIIELISNSGNILSYLRLFAVGLSAALIANLATDIGFAIAGALPVPVVGALLGIIVALAVHLIAVALTIIGHTLQPLRLQYVEFFTKFGFYDANGRPYKPFRLLGGKA
ncbi:MAG TPA: V-type ATPase 116kDa subunit family protein [Trueperaceae bacterium]